jgi:hypothetical protein
MFESFLNKALELVDRSAAEGIPLRLMGACAVRLHSPDHAAVLSELQRNPTDLDFVAYGRYRTPVNNLFIDLGYAPRTRLMVTLENPRQIYDSRDHVTVDVFFDELAMCHTIDFRGRLEADNPTIPLAELLLAKTQIVQINEKDIKDVVVLLAEHEVGSGDKETVNEDLIATTLSKHWGFYYTVTTNLRKIKDRLTRYQQALTNRDIELVNLGIDRLLMRIESEPKSMGWRARASIGTKKKWYTEVEETGRGTLADFLTSQRRNEG